MLLGIIHQVTKVRPALPVHTVITVLSQLICQKPARQEHLVEFSKRNVLLVQMDRILRKTVHRSVFCVLLDIRAPMLV